MHNHTGHAPIPIVTSKYSLYRVKVYAIYDRQLEHALATIRPGEGKLLKIQPGTQVSYYDIILSDEDLVMFRLMVPTVYCEWLQEYTHG